MTDRFTMCLSQQCLGAETEARHAHMDPSPLTGLILLQGWCTVSEALTTWTIPVLSSFICEAPQNLIITGLFMQFPTHTHTHSS